MDICPFVYGRPVRPGEFVDRNHELQRLLGRLVSDQSTAIVGQPKSGKTSLLNYVQDREQRRKIAGDRLEHSIFAYIDSQTLSSRFNQLAFWKQALTPLTEQFPSGDIADIYATTAANDFGTFTLEQFFCAVGEARWQFVLMIDEFDSLLTHAVLNSAEFYGGLRSLTSRCKGFALIIASRRSLSLLNDETQPFNPHGSPYFNVFTELRLGPLPKGHSQKLLSQARPSFNRQDTAFILKVSGRHPYLLQLAAASLWELNNQGRKDDERYRDAADETYHQTGAHFADVWKSRSNAEKKVMTAIALAQIQGIVDSHTFAWNDLIEDISDYHAELQGLKKDGTILEGNDQNWQLSQQALLWWLADEIKRNTRDDSSFTEWLCQHEMDGLFTKEECDKVSQVAKTVGGFLGKGATTLIETFAKGLATGAVKAMGL